MLEDSSSKGWTDGLDWSVPAGGSLQAGFFQGIVTLYVLHDQRLWSRVQTLFAIQVALLAGAHALRESVASSLILAIGAITSVIIGFLIIRDMSVRDVIVALMHRLAVGLSPRWVIDECGYENQRMLGPNRVSTLHLLAHPKDRPGNPGTHNGVLGASCAEKLPGWQVLVGSAYLLALIDLVLAALIRVSPQLY